MPAVVGFGFRLTASKPRGLGATAATGRSCPTLIHMLNISHFAHPLRTAKVAQMRLQAHVQLRRFAAKSDAQFLGDPRYELQNVTDGFVSRLDDSGDDSVLLRRICSAYRKAIADQRGAPAWYGPTEWWKELRRSSLGPVMSALENGDTEGLQRMYRNFFRDGCVAGLVGVPFGMWKAYFYRQMKDVLRRAYLGDALYRLDYWKSRTGGQFEVRDLAGPDIGNPYGVLLGGTLVRHNAEYHHYCAHEILKLEWSEVNSSRSVIAEIGGGYGALAYYLLRDGGKGRRAARTAPCATGRPQLTYLDFDVPESVALASYYLMKTFPSMNFMLYGEKELTEETIAESDVGLLPAFAMPKMPKRIVHVTFASHVLSDLAPGALAAYMNFVSASTRDYFMYFGGEAVVASISRILRESDRRYADPHVRASDWNRHKVADIREVECTYGFAGS